MPQVRTEATDVKSGEEKEDPAGGIKTLGVLFVHGIGAQRRGDTLVQCGATIHGWLRDWITQSTIEGGSISVDLLDTSLTQPRADEPAHTRLIFRKHKAIAQCSWLLAESCWAEAFHPPNYREFARWALKVLPLTVILHLVPAFRRNLRIMRTAGKVMRGPFSFEDLAQLQMDLGPKYGPLPFEALALRKILADEENRADNRWLISPFLLAAFLFVAIFVQATLLAVMVVGLLPIGFLRSFASRMQKTIAALLGDIYLFVASPISASAVVAQVKKDFEWLAERSDNVVILAHSQGAAVAHRAIEEWSWKGRLPEKLKHLITYGSGLRKLFDLRQLSRDQTPADTLRLVMTGVAAVVGFICIMISSLWLVGEIPFLLFALSFTAGYVFLMLALFFAEGVSQVDPELQVGVLWTDLFASHDPVPGGPITVSAAKLIPPDESELARVLSSIPERLVEFFHLGQRTEVVNLQSSIADHNAYWSAKDDFVGRVVMQLLRISDIPSPARLDSEWLGLARQRRRWRVGLRTGCRNVAILAALCIAFWPREVIGLLGRRVTGFCSWVVESLPKQWMPDWTQSVAVSDRQLGIGVLLICIFIVFSIAATGWSMWERREFGFFFRRKPFRAGGVGLAIFAMGWLGILVVIPAVTILAVGGQALWPSEWNSALLFVISGWTVVRFGKGPGRFSSWIAALLEQGELLLEQKTGDRSENLARAKSCFSWAVKWLLDEKDSMERVRALFGMARVLEQTEEMNEDEFKRLQALYTEALISLERMGKDAGAVRERLENLSTVAASSAATQGASPS